MRRETFLAGLTEYVNGSARKTAHSQWRNFASEFGDIEPVIELTSYYGIGKRFLPEVRAAMAAERNLAFRAARALRNAARELDPLSRIHRNCLTGVEDIRSSPQSLEHLRDVVLKVAGAREAQVDKGDTIKRRTNEPLVSACIYIEQVTGKQQCKQHYDQVAHIVEALCYALKITNKKNGEEVDQEVDGDAIRLIVARFRDDHSRSYGHLEEVVHDFITWKRHPLAVAVLRPSIAACIAAGSENVLPGLKEFSRQVCEVLCEEPGTAAHAAPRQSRYEQVEEPAAGLDGNWQRQCLVQDVRWTLKNADRPMDRARIGRSLIRGGHVLSFRSVDSALDRLKTELDVVTLANGSKSYRLLESRVVESIIKLGDTEADAEMVKFRDGFKCWLETQPIEWSPYAYLAAFDILSGEDPNRIITEQWMIHLRLDLRYAPLLFDRLAKLIRQYVQIAGVTNTAIIKKLGISMS